MFTRATRYIPTRSEQNEHRVHRKEIKDNKGKGVKEEEGGGGGNSLIIPSPPLPINRAKPSHDDAHSDIRTIIAIRSSSAPALAPALLAWTRHDAHDLGVAHLEVRRAVGGGLGPDLGMQTAQFVPSAPVDAQER